MDLAIEERVNKLFNDHNFDDVKTVDENGWSQLRSLIVDGGYVIPPENTLFSRFSPLQEGGPVVDFFSYRNMSSGRLGVSHIQIKLDGYDDAHDFVERYNLRMQPSLDRRRDLGLGALGGIGGVAIDIIGLGIADASASWNPSAWWLAVPPLVAGGIALVEGYRETSKKMDIQWDHVADFKERYGERISLGKDAILSAVGLKD